MTFKEKLINLRKIKGITQEEFAKAVGVSRQAVYKWESGQSYPEVTKLIEIKLLFGISIDDLLDESYEVNLPEKKRRRRKENAVKETVSVTPPTEEEILPEKTEEIKGEAEEKPEEITPMPEKEEAKEEKKEEEKKIGFFGRLFGRR